MNILQSKLLKVEDMSSTGVSRLYIENMIQEYECTSYDIDQAIRLVYSVSCEDTKYVINKFIKNKKLKLKTNNIIENEIIDDEVLIESKCENEIIDDEDINNKINLYNHLTEKDYQKVKIISDIYKISLNKAKELYLNNKRSLQDTINSIDDEHEESIDNIIEIGTEDERRRLGVNMKLYEILSNPDKISPLEFSEYTNTLSNENIVSLYTFLYNNENAFDELKNMTIYDILNLAKDNNKFDISYTSNHMIINESSTMQRKTDGGHTDIDLNDWIVNTDFIERKIIKKDIELFCDLIKREIYIAFNKTKLSQNDSLYLDIREEYPNSNMIIVDLCTVKSIQNSESEVIMYEYTGELLITIKSIFNKPVSIYTGSFVKTTEELIDNMPIIKN